MKSIIHWCKRKKVWSNHDYKSCTKAPVILIEGDWYTETKPLKKTNPKGFVVANHTQVIINPDKETLDKYEKTEAVFYDKQNVKFSHSNGKHILFDEEGCFLLKEK